MLYTKNYQILFIKKIPILIGLKVSSLACRYVFYRTKQNAKGGTEQGFPYSLHQKSIPQKSNLALKKALNFQNHSSSGSLNPVKKFLPVKFPIFSYWGGGNLRSPLKSRWKKWGHFSSYHIYYRSYGH